jgi:translation initiation factor 1 (eIF-1/SUI1)
MEWNLLALGYDNYTNYIKLPQSILVEFNKSDDNIEVQVIDSKKRKSIMDEYEKSPFYFCIESSIDTFCYCGVQDFTADEGLVYIPNHLLDQLAINGCDVVTVKYINNVPKGEFVVIEPLNKEIFDIKDLDKYLEKVISGYCVLYQNQVINFQYEDNNYKILIKKIKAVDDIETNLIDVVNTDLFFDIHNKFLEEELRLKELEEKRLKELEELKMKEQEIAQTNKLFLGEGKKVGGNTVYDPALVREMRLKKLGQSNYQIEKSIFDLKINDNTMEFDV